MEEKRQWSLEMESSPGEEATKTVEMRTEDLEYYRNSAAKVAAGFERTNSTSERISMGKSYQTTLASAEVICERKSPSVRQTSVLPYFKNKTATPKFNSHRLDQSAAINIQARPSTSKELMIC